MGPTEMVYEAIWNRKQYGSDVIAPGSRGAVALELIGSGEKVLDIGCGDGVLAGALQSRFKWVYGADISGAAVDIARERGIEAAQVNLDTHPLPYPDGTFTAITCLDVLEHVFDPRPVVREIARVCTCEATLVVTTPNIRYWRHILAIMRGRFPRTSSDEEAYDGGHLHYYTAANLIELLSPWFTLQQVRGVYGGPVHGPRAVLLRTMLRGRLGEELRCPGIAICARRTSALA